MCKRGHKYVSTATANVEREHESHKESVVGHYWHHPQDDEGTEEYRVTATLHKLLLFTRFVVHRATKAVVGIQGSWKGSKIYI